ncbi:ornithine carbamoyltransferase [Anaerobiospirillum thomasii]|uniref:Ornithine carbamoyltransferase n=1 Tax=Anaerobiospirillum thomasii TaxID=179995 RepID=A0A2X0V7I7_9GAMM|nr:ornithine carbamoyltransferase [Anaerobiospirillum thomasii]SPT69066.1 Ornithine carbamoyltransferase [Anaerobiospirillum thomasii]
MRHLLTGFEFSKEEYEDIIDTASKMKANPALYSDTLKGKSAAIMFEKPSLRTRTTFEIALFRLGAHGVYLDLQSGDLGKRESIPDYARNLSRWTDCLVGRVFAQSTLEELAATGSVPVINALSDLYHPAQAMADYMTVKEHLGSFENVKLAYLGDGNNVTNSLLVAGAILGVNVTCFCPLGHGPDIQIFNKASEIARKHGCTLNVTDDLSLLKNYDVLYTDTWVSMGDNTPLDAVKKIYMPYQINAQTVEASSAKIVMHCLPAHRGFEITDDVMDGDKSVVFDEAENRLHIHMSLLSKLIKA